MTVSSAATTAPCWIPSIKILIESTYGFKVNVAEAFDFARLGVYNILDWQMGKKENIAFWIRSSDQDFKTMSHLIKNKDYAWAMFIGHLVIEKLLKALYIQNIGDDYPFIHDLLRIAEKSKVKLSSEKKDDLDRISTFNINARYDDYKSEFRRACNKRFALKWYKKIIEMRKWIKKQL